MRGPGGGSTGVGLRGPGETQLEVDRRRIKERIAYLKRELEEIRTHRQLYRQKRKREAIPVIAIVGYTNAGKSTLLNALANSDVLVEDKLFATLDPTTRRVKLPGGKVVLFTDTVGFIQKLPPQLLAAFRATLEEVSDASIIVHVLDITNPNAEAQNRIVWEVLEDLGVAGKPVITALNKIDRLENPELLREISRNYPDVVAISALKKIGLDKLLERIETLLKGQYVPVEAFIPYDKGHLLDLCHRQGIIDKEEHRDEGVYIKGHLPASLAEKLSSL